MTKNPSISSQYCAQHLLYWLSNRWIVFEIHVRYTQNPNRNLFINKITWRVSTSLFAVKWACVCGISLNRSASHKKSFPHSDFRSINLLNIRIEWRWRFRRNTIQLQSNRDYIWINIFVCLFWYLSKTNWWEANNESMVENKKKITNISEENHIEYFS